MPTVLVVDDSADTVLVLTRLLEGINCRVVGAGNGEEAIAVALRARPDLILMDLHMPVMDGLEATRRMRRLPELCGVPILAVTAYDVYGIREGALEAGCDEYLTKPLRFDELRKNLLPFLPF